MKYGVLLLLALCVLTLLGACVQLLCCSTLRERGLILALILLLTKDTDRPHRI